MKHILLLVLSLAAATLPAQLHLSGTGTNLTVAGNAQLRSNGDITVENGADLRLSGTNAGLISLGTVRVRTMGDLELTGTNAAVDVTEVIVADGRVRLIGLQCELDTDEMTVLNGGEVQLIGSFAYLDVDNETDIDNGGLITTATAGNQRVDSEILRVLSGGELQLRSSGSELFTFDEFQVLNNGTFLLRGKAETDVTTLSGEVVFQVAGDDDLFLNFGSIETTGFTSFGGTIESELVGGYAPTSDQTYRLVQLTPGSQFTATPGSFILPAPNDWAYDVDQDHIDLEFRLMSLPVELLSFTGRWEGKSARLDWTTATESGSSHFEVERQNLAGSWDVIGTVQAAGESISERAYDFHDDTPGPTNPVLYRLRQLDLDGTATLSDVVALTRTEATALDVFPNPATDQINVSHAGGETYRITDAAGRQVAAGALNAGGLTRLALPASLASGTYVLRTGAGEVKRFVVKGR